MKLGAKTILASLAGMILMIGASVSAQADETFSAGEELLENSTIEQYAGPVAVKTYDLEAQTRKFNLNIQQMKKTKTARTLKSVSIADASAAAVVLADDSSMAVARMKAKSDGKRLVSIEFSDEENSKL